MGCMKREYAFLALIFFAVFAVRIFISFQTPHFSYESYFTSGQVMQIIEKGVPSFSYLSYSAHVFLPVFHYILALSSLLMPLHLGLKIIPNFFASCLVIASYFLAYEITKHRTASLFSAFSAGFLPIYFSETVNTLSVHSFTVPLFLFLIYCFIKIENPRFLGFFLAGLLLFALADPSVIILILGLLFYLAFARAEKLEHAQIEAEVIFFSTLFVMWLVFLVFKGPLLSYGPLAIWQNIPEEILSSKFAAFSILESIYSLGIMPFLAGMFLIYLYFLREKLKKTHLLMSFAVVIFILLWLQFVEIDVGLCFLGAIFSILFGQFYAIFSSFISRTKISSFKPLITALFAFALVFSSAVPSVNSAFRDLNDAPSEEIVVMFEWARDNLENGSVVLAPVEQGHMVAFVAEKHNVIDSHFLFAEDAGERFADVDRIYSLNSETEVIRMLNKYGVDYIVPAIIDGEVSPSFVESDDACFKRVYYDEPGIYRLVCDVI